MNKKQSEAECYYCHCDIDDGGFYNDYYVGPYCKKCISHSLHGGCYALQTDIRNYRDATFLVIHDSRSKQSWFQRAFPQELVIEKRSIGQTSIAWNCINGNKIRWYIIDQSDCEHPMRYERLRGVVASAVFVGETCMPDPFLYWLLTAHLHHQARPVNIGEPLLRPYLYQSGYMGGVDSNPLIGRQYPEDIVVWAKERLRK